MKISFREIANRITGISIPIFGISWEPPRLDIEEARRLLTFLEDRRVLYNPFTVEVPEHAIESVIQIRQRLTTTLEQINRTSPLAESASAMRASCRKFLDQIQKLNVKGTVWDSSYRMDIFSFFCALGELRGVCGIHIAQIAVRYGIDVEEQLAQMFPSPLEKE